MFKKKKFTIEKTTNPKACEVELEIIIPKEVIAEHRTEALSSLNKNVQIDGFRPGHVPEKVLIDKVGEYTITEEACRNAIDTMFSDIVVESKHIPINQPQIEVIKLAVDTDATIRVKFATPPEIELGNYKKIAKKHLEHKKDVEPVTQDEVDAVLLDLRKQVAHMEYHHKHTEDTEHSHGDLEPVELNDGFAQKVGPYKTVEELTTAIKENLLGQKTQTTTEKFRLALIDEIVDDSKISYPEFFLTAEQNIILEEVRADLARMGATLESYLKQIGKTEAELKEEKKDVADKRVKTQLVLSKIAAVEEIKPDEKVVEEQVTEIQKSYPNANKENIQSFVERFELNQLVWKMLEDLK